MTEPTRRAGRPRSEEARRSIHAATLQIVARLGYGALTMDALAAEAGVGKQTLYRWWPSRAAIVLEVVRELAAKHVRDPDTGSLRRDLTRFLASTFGVPGKEPAVPALLCGLMAEAQLDAGFREQLRVELIEPRRAALRALLLRARDRGELHPRCDVDFCLDLAFGVLWYRLLVGHAPLDYRAAKKLAVAVTRAASA